MIEVPVPNVLPDPPEEMTLLCTCGARLRITRHLYNHRVQCPNCDVQMALHLTFDPKEQRYGIDARKSDVATAVLPRQV